VEDYRSKKARRKSSSRFLRPLLQGRKYGSPEGLREVQKSLFWITSSGGILRKGRQLRRLFNEELVVLY
jgi:hypothetical protein